MSQYGVDVRTPIFYRHSFASALETQSIKSYSRLTHTPVVAEHLPRGAASGARISQYASSHVRSLEELGKLLNTVLEDPSVHAGTTTFNVSVREPGADEFERTVLSPSSLARVEAAQSRLAKKEAAHAEERTGVAAAGESFAYAANGGRRALSPPSSERKLPRSVSFPADAYSASQRLHRDAAPTGASSAGNANVDVLAAAEPAESRRRRLWRRMRGWVWRESGEAPAALHSFPSSPGVNRHCETGINGGDAGANASVIHGRSARREGTSSAAGDPSPASAAPAASMQRVPAWVRAAFTPASAVTAAATVDRAPSTPSRGRCTSSAQETSGGAGTATGGASSSQTREDVAMPHGASVSDSGNVTATFAGESAAFAEGGPSGPRSAGDGASSHPAELSRFSRSAQGTAYAPSSIQHHSVPTEPYLGNSGMERATSADDVLRSSLRTNKPADSSSFSSPPPSAARTQMHVSMVSDGRERDGELPWSRGLPLPVNTAATADTTTPTPSAATAEGGVSATQREEEEDATAAAPDRRDGKSLRLPNDPSSTTTNTATTSDRQQTNTASSSSFATHLDARRGTTAQLSSVSHNVAGAATTNTALARWDRHAYAVELVGWLNLLVWVRCQVILFLRDLSGVQGVVAWSAWYWSWAQEHPWQAAVHQGLSSRRFWRGLWRRGLAAQLSEVQYETSGHMFTLKNAFRLIVTYIGAAYSSLEQLNGAILQIQHHCEMSATPLAAAAVAAAARTYMAGLGSGHLGNVVAGGAGVSLTTLPEMSSSMNRAYALGRRDLLSNQNSMFWSPAPAMTPVVDEFSPLAPPPRARDGRESRADVSGSPFVIHRSAFDDAAELESAHETAVAEAAEEAEAVSALLVLDKLRGAVWAMLQEQRDIFRSNVRQLDVLESNDFFGWPADGLHADARPAPNASTAQAAAAMPPSAGSVLFGASTRAETQPGSPWMRGTMMDEAQTRNEEHHHDADRPITARDGAFALLQCVQHSQRLVQRLKVLAQRAHSPPASRHWQRIVVASALTIPPFVWLYRKTPEELVALTHARYTFAHQVVNAYLIEPIKQLRDSLFYVRPGVEDRRSAFERDAASLANVIRDFHEDMYPNMPLDRLEAMRERTLECLRAGVADGEGFGLIDQQYRHSVRHPIRSVFFGDLPRILLIQLSYQALEMSRVANGVDEVLEGNDLNFKVMALMPVFAAGGLLFSWFLFRYRATYKPLRMRMKVLWRSLFRVVSFAGSGQDVSPPFLRGFTQRTVPIVPTSRPSAVPRRPPARQRHGEEDLAQTRAGARRRAGAAATASADYGLAEVDPADFTESSEEESASMTESISTRDGVASVQRLNNYEQGMVLLLSHVIRSMTAEYLRSYAYFHELMEDLNDLESVRSSRHQRLATLERMRATHSSLF